MRGLLRSDAEAEHILQEAYVRALAHLSTFRGDAFLSAWWRIVINEARGRLPKGKRAVAMPDNPEAQVSGFHSIKRRSGAAQRQILGLVERV
ncbi:sigma factor [Mesorhizobium sp.]|uniref:sigma factor n=1 Tax=Mesorhizobium sp. TaxID=1871066 RepID=UPI00338F15AC